MNLLASTDLLSNAFSSVVASLASSSKGTGRKIKQNISANIERFLQLLKDLQEATTLNLSENLFNRIGDHMQRLEKGVSIQNEIFGVSSGP